MRHFAETRIQPPSKLLGEAEAEGSHDVGEVLKNIELQVQPSGKKFLVEFKNVKGTPLEEIDLNNKQPLLVKNNNRL